MPEFLTTEAIEKAKGMDRVKSSRLYTLYVYAAQHIVDPANELKIVHR